MIDGLDPSSLDDDFVGAMAGRTLILDGDGPAYTVAATVKTLPTAIRRYQSHVLEAMFLAKAESAVVHFTDENSTKSNRFNVIGQKPYQGQRISSAKPPLLGSVRRAMSHEDNWLPEFHGVLHTKWEADDAMMMDSYSLGPKGITRSEDKDLRMTPYAYYDIKTGVEFGYEEWGHLYAEYTGSGQMKCMGHGPKFFWAQMMMGDSADNVRGLALYKSQLCGPAKTLEALDKFNDPNECANFVIDQYRAIDQNPIPEGWFLWLLRTPNDSFWNYCQEFDWTAFNREFLDKCLQREWYKDADD